MQHIFNQKIDLLYVTPKGEAINNEHMRIDAVVAKQKLQILLCNCPLEEVGAFHKVIHEFIKMLDEDFCLPTGI
jgi:hypothetical protein